MFISVSHNLGSETKRATGAPLYMMVGQCGSVLGAHIFPATDGPRYIRGFAVSCGLQFAGALAAAVLSVSGPHTRDDTSLTRTWIGFIPARKPQA